MKTSNYVFQLIAFQIEGRIDIIYFLMVLKCIHLKNNSFWATELLINILSLFILFFPFYCFLQSLKFFSNFLVLYVYFNADFVGITLPALFFGSDPIRDRHEKTKYVKEGIEHICYVFCVSFLQ